MSNWKTCAAAVRDASGRDLSDDQVADIFERAQLKQRALTASGQLDGIDARLREAIKADADELAVQAALVKKHAALSVIAKDRTVRHVEGLIGRGLSYRKAVLALFEGSTKGVEGARHSIAATKLAYEGRYVGGMMARIVREVPHAEGMLRDREFLDDVVREMMQPGSTRNADAAKVGVAFAESAEVSRVDLNNLGANIGKLDGWAGAQIHDADKIGRLAPEAWIDALMPKLDLARTFPDLDEAGARKALGNVWENIVFQRERGDSPDPAGTGFHGPVNVARALERHRVLHFKTPDDWLAYSRDFGSGHIFDGMLGHQSRAALNASQMEILGPNPGATLDAVLDTLRRRVDVDEKIAPAKKAGVKEALTRDGQTAVGMAFRIASGATMIPVSRTMADVGGGIRALQSMSKLGGAVISSITDLPTAIVNLRFNGMSFGEAAGGQVRELLAGRGKGEQRELAYLTGEGFDGVVGHLTSPYVANDGAPGAMQSVMSSFFRWTGLSLWTDANRAASARVLSAHLGRQAGKEFLQLDARLQNVFRQHDITPEVWDAIRAGGVREIDGRRYIVPDGMAERISASRSALPPAVRPLPDGWRVEVKNSSDDANHYMSLVGADGREHYRAHIIDNSEGAPGVYSIGGIENASRVGKGLGPAFYLEAAKYVEARGGRLIVGADATKSARAVHGVLEKAGYSREADPSIFGMTREEMAAQSGPNEDGSPTRLLEIASKPDRPDIRSSDEFADAADLALRRYFADEVASSVLEADAATQRFTTAGTSRGTAAGEAIRFVMQFKAFPIAFTQRVGGRAMQGGPEGTSAGTAHIGALIAGLTVMGYAAMTAKDAIRGYEPRELVDEQGNPRAATILAALVQGGGAGIYGDFLFGSVSRSGNSALENVAGPAISDAARWVNLLSRARDGDAKTADALTAAIGSTPFANVFYARPALDYLILNSLRERLAPGYLQRQDARRREQYGQDPLIAPSDRMALDLF